MKLLRVNMADLHTQVADLPRDYQMLSGRALTSRIISDEIPATCHPLGPNNKLVIANGLFAGTSLSSSGRISIGAKSPLTLGIKESNGGGNTATKMARLGLRGIVIEGEALKDKWYLLYINKNGANLVDGSFLKDKGTYTKVKILNEQYGPKAGIILIGPAGEHLAITAGITNTDNEGNPSRYCGRGGLGAVMGAKRVLAIVLDDEGTQAPKPLNSEKFKELLKEYNSLILHTPQTKESFPKYGTAGMMEITNTIGGLPTRNFSTGCFAGADKINGEALYNTITARGGQGTPTHSCMPGCIIRCSNIYPDEAGKSLVSPLEYETLALIGSNCDIDDLDTIAKLNYFCNDYGIDTIEFGCTIGVLMEAGIIPFGAGDRVLEIAKEMEKGSYLGKIIAAGSVIAGRIFGVTKIPAVKGQGMPAYDPRAIKGLGVTYATSPMGADHTAGNTVRLNIKHHLKDNQVEVSKNAQLGSALLDALGLCVMVGAAVKDRVLLAKLISSHIGLECTEEDLVNIAQETLNRELKFNRDAGFTDAHDILPEHFYAEENAASESVFDILSEELK